MTEETLFERLVQTPQAERVGLLEKLTEGDRELRERMLKLLQAHAAQQSAAIDPTELHQLLAEPENADLDATSDGQRPRTGSSASHKIGSLIAGRYLLRELIAEGGMGAVWLATQGQPVKRKVALKLIKAGMDSRQVIARFEAERQALAMMDHPNIAKVFDGGVTDEGRPFFVMEYVKGIPLTEYCDQARVSVKERLGLFIDVCQAIQHAHQKGIVHRDLKPSNILVCLYDGKPVVKVIDFGLAKAMHQPLTEHSIFTSHGVMVGTPLYMSPEQAEYNNLDVDTRTDIYSLGVILYELLTGTTPLEREQLRTAAYNEVLRLIKEVEPPRPSMRLSKSASLPSIAAQRSVDPKYLSRSLSGDLDWIVMKSLEKDRSRRYESATGLARDVERYLNEEAIEARPPSSTYRLSKYLKKHKLQATAFSLVLLAMIAGSAAAGWGWFTARKAEQQVRESLAEVSAERDAKETALAAEEIQRKEAEQQREAAESALISGLLRPIGFGTEAETNALVDWQRLPTDQLKIRALKAAFNAPNMIEQLSKSSSEVLLASVGLSTARRANAIAFLRSFEADSANNTEARDVARMLLIELGVLDFSVEQLILRDDVSEGIKKRVLSLLETQVSKLSQEQVVVIANACIDAAITAPGTKVRDPLGDYNDLFVAVIPKLTLENRDSISNRMRAEIKDSNSQCKNIWIGVDVLNNLDVMLEPDEFELVWKRMLQPIGDSEQPLEKEGSGFNPNRVEKDRLSSFNLYHLRYLLPHVPEDSVWDIYQYAVKLCEGPENYYELGVVEETFESLAPRLAPQFQQAAWNDICDRALRLTTPTVASSWDEGEPFTFSYRKILQLLAGQLTNEELQLNWKRAIAIDANRSIEHRQLRTDLLRALGPYIINSEQVNVLSDTVFLELVSFFEKEVYGNDPASKIAWAEFIAACIPKVSPEVSTDAYESCVTGVIRLVEEDDYYFYWDHADFVATLVALKEIAKSLPRDWFASRWEQIRNNIRSEKPRSFHLDITFLSIVADYINVEDLPEAWTLFTDIYSQINSQTDNGITDETAKAFCRTICERLEKDELRRIHTQLNQQITDHRDFSDDEKNAVAFSWLELAALLSRSPHATEQDRLLVLDATIQFLILDEARYMRDLSYREELYQFVDQLSDQQIADLAKKFNGVKLETKLERSVAFSYSDVYPMQEVVGLGIALCKRLQPSDRRELVLRLLRENMLFFADGTNRELAYDLLKLVNDTHPLLQLYYDFNIFRERKPELLPRFEEICLHQGANVFTHVMVEDENRRKSLKPTGDWPERKFLTIYDLADWINKNWPDFREEDLWTDELPSP